MQESLSSQMQRNSDMLLFTYQMNIIMAEKACCARIHYALIMTVWQDANSSQANIYLHPLGKPKGARPPIEVPPMIKIMTKCNCFFSFSYFWHFRLQQYTSVQQ